MAKGEVLESSENLGNVAEVKWLWTHATGVQSKLDGNASGQNQLKLQASVKKLVSTNNIFNVYLLYGTSFRRKLCNLVR